MSLSACVNRFSDQLPYRGYGVIYRENEVNHCPGCGRTHWHIGRVTAECAFCATALPLEVQSPAGRAIIKRRRS